jgi:hypothetical protein
MRIFCYGRVLVLLLICLSGNFLGPESSEHILLLATCLGNMTRLQRLDLGSNTLCPP